MLTPTEWMDSLRVIGTARQPTPPDLHIEARRRLEAEQAAAEKAAAEGKKHKSKAPIPRPEYPQNLPPQQRYDLRYTTPDEPPPEPAAPPMPEKSGARKLGEQMNPMRRRSADASKNTPPGASASGASTPDTADSPHESLRGAAAERSKWPREKIKVCAMAHGLTQNVFALKKHT